MLVARHQEEAGTSLVATFLLGNTLYGLDTTNVQEIVRVGSVTRVHHAPDYILGIMNLRGKIVTIIDSGQKLSLEELKVTDESRIIILEWTGEYVGLLVDTVLDVIPLETDRVVPSPASISAGQGRYLAGVYQPEGRPLVTLLNIEAVLAQDES